MDKPAFLSRLQRERDKFELLLNRVGFTRQLTMNGVVDNLSVKDLLADILTREQFIADRLDDILHGEQYAPCVSHSALDDFQKTHGFPDYESPLCEKDVNHLVVHKHKNVALEEIVAQEIAAYSNIIASLQKLTLDQCLDHALFPRIAEQTIKPYRRLGVEINRWLKSIAGEAK